ncbi:unnamed protein product [Danaus chrysippus]|uniref:(African queen) hypothetical protein n=1 Tax=Danaus chrysippus TaxID=151541 RepID=A0A8J2R065_9NEOP|nr:unnamed protein product [Danaus chrysippus]
MPTKSSTVLCSAHFEDLDKYTTPKGYVRLKTSAVPVVSWDMVPRACTPTSLNDVNISDMDSVFDSPRKTTLKKRAQKLTLQKTEL